MSIGRPYSRACENNKDPILKVLAEQFVRAGVVLEIGSGTGQHAVYFAEHLSHLEWQATDLAENLPGIRAWFDSVELTNLRTPVELDVSGSNWERFDADYVFSANTLHILSWNGVEDFFSGLENTLNSRGMLAIYGPFNYGGCYTSESNARFDQWLRERDPRSGIRDFEEVNRLASAAGLSLIKDYAMPANNRTLIWRSFRNG